MFEYLPRLSSSLGVSLPLAFALASNAPVAAAEDETFTAKAPMGWPADTQPADLCDAAVGLLSAQELKEADGETVTASRSGASPIGVVGVLVDASPELVARVVMDYGRYASRVDALAYSEVIAEWDSGLMGIGAVDTPFLFPAFTWGLRVEATSTSHGVEVAFADVPGVGTIDAMMGCWHIEALPSDPGRTAVHLGVVIDTGVRLPAVVAAWGTSRVLPEVVDGVVFEGIESTTEAHNAS